MNTYSYALENPVRFSDPTGLFVAPLVIPVAEGIINTIGIGLAIKALFFPSDGLSRPTSPADNLPGDAANDDDLCPPDDKCELWYNSLILEEIKIKEDARGAPPGANEIVHAARIRARKIAWNNEVDKYNSACPRKIGRRFKV